jgi:hypothetical protein
MTDRVVAALGAGLMASGMLMAVATAGPASANPALNGNYLFDWYGDPDPMKETVVATSCGPACLTLAFDDGSVVDYHFFNNAWVFTRWMDDAVICGTGQQVGAEQTTFINPEFTAGRNVASADCGQGVRPMRPSPFAISRL